MKDYQGNFYSGEKKLVAVSPRSVPHHLQDRVADSLENIIKIGVVEEHPSNELVPRVSCVVIVTRDDGSLRVTFDARNLPNSKTREY